MSLYWRVFAANAGLLIAGALALALTPATISAPIQLTQGIVLAVGVLGMVAANLLLLRPLFAPLERLARRMENVDLLRAGQRVPVTAPSEIGALERAFNTMLTRLEAERREAGGRVLVAQEEERRRIALSLHDEVGQTMTGILFQLKRLAERVPGQQRDEVTEAQEAVRGSLEEVRRIAQDLRPVMLDHLGLTSALTSLSRTFSQRTGISVRRRLESHLPPLESQVELALYRVAQEGLTNVARHADATEVRLSLERSNGSVVLRIVDNGSGFRGEPVDGGGLRGIRERALMIGGALAVKPGLDGGVEIRLQVPMVKAQ